MLFLHVILGFVGFCSLMNGQIHRSQRGLVRSPTVQRAMLLSAQRRVIRFYSYLSVCLEGFISQCVSLALTVQSSLSLGASCLTFCMAWSSCLSSWTCQAAYPFHNFSKGVRSPLTLLCALHPRLCDGVFVCKRAEELLYGSPHYWNSCVCTLNSFLRM